MKIPYFCNLKKFLFISLCFCYLASTTEFHEVFKLPALVSHYFDHHRENPELGILNFLKLHYSSGSDSNDQEDQKLPFKSHPEFAYSNIILHFHTGMQVFVWKSNLSHKPDLIPGSALFLQSDYLSKIWQPPKLLSFF